MEAVQQSYCCMEAIKGRWFSKAIFSSTERWKSGVEIDCCMVTNGVRDTVMESGSKTLQRHSGAAYQQASGLKTYGARIGAKKRHGHRLGVAPKNSTEHGERSTKRCHARDE